MKNTQKTTIALDKEVVEQLKKFKTETYNDVIKELLERLKK